MIRRIRSSFDRKRRSRRKETADASSISAASASTGLGTVIVEDESTPKIIENLVMVVEANRERLISGEARLSLTPASLLTVNTAFNKYQADLRLQQECVSLSSHDSGINGLLSRSRAGLTSPSADEIEFRVDTYVIRVRKADVNVLERVMTKTKALKISHGADTILGRIRLAPLFNELVVLELKRIPIHLVCGMSQLRASLTSLSAIRSLASLEEIFVKCGGDATEPQSWVCLKSANLGCNGIVRLDSSLRLLPKLELLDVSHNLLTSTEHFLEYLPELRLLNLSYNRLESFPSLSYSARRRLTVLSLRGNNLDHLNGLDVLTDLTELDVRDNCICEMRALEPMSQLHMLQSVAFLGNPIAFMKDYRNVALQFISRRAAFDRQILFDGRELTKKETAFLPHHPPRLLTKTNNDSVENILTLSLPLDGARSGRTPLAERAKKKGRNSSRKSRLAREAVITDVEDTETPYDTDADVTIDDVHSGFASLLSQDDEATAGSGVETDNMKRTPSQKSKTELEETDINEMKAKVEELRLSRGHDWLQEWPGIVQSRQTEDPSLIEADESGMSDVNENFPTATENGSEYASPGVNISTALTMSTTPSSAVGWAEAVAKDDVSDKRGNEDVELVTEEEKVVAPFKDYGLELNSFIVSNDCRSEPDCPFCNSEDGGQTDNTHVDRLRFLSVTAKYIVEKDLDGDVLEEMEFSCMESKETVDLPKASKDSTTTAVEELGESTSEEPISALATADDDQQTVSEPTHFHPSIRLRFSYIRKDRRLRHYWFEDAESFVSFVDLLESLVKRKDASNATIHHCLRCSHEFLWQKNEAKPNHAVSRTSRRQEVDMALSNAPPLICPQCQSPLIVELESNPDGEEVKVASLPTDDADAMAVTVGPGMSDGQSVTAVSGGEEVGGEVARISWIEKSPSIVNDSTEQSPVVSEPPLATASSDSSIAIITSECASQHVTPSSSSTLITDKSSQPPVNFSLTTPIASPFVHRPNPSLDPAKHNSKDPSPQPSSSGSIVPADEEEDEAERARDSHLVSSIERDGEEGESGSVDSAKMQTPPSGSFVDGFSAAASLTKTVFQNMAASVIASSLGNSPSPSVGTVESNYADATSASPLKRVKSQVQQEQQQQAEQTVQQQQLPTPPLKRDESFAFQSLSFDTVDHRLSLYFDLVLFGDDEEFVSVLCADVVESGNPPSAEDGSRDVYASNPFLVVTSTIRIYFLRISGEMRGQPDTWLTLVDDLPLTSLAYLDWGLGLLSFRLEFVSHNSPNHLDSSDQLGSCYCVIIRDEKRCMKYVRGLIDQVKRSTSSPLSQLKSISKQQNPESIQNLMTALGRQNLDNSDDATSLAQETSFKYFLVLDISSLLSPFSPITLVISDGDIHILSENFHHPPPRDLPPPPQQVVDVPQFLVKRTINVTEVADISLLGRTVNPDSSQLLSSCRLTYFDQSEPSEFGFETSDALDAFVNSVAKLWEDDFGVELEILRETESSR